MEEKINETAVWNRVTAASREGSKTSESETGPIGPGTFGSDGTKTKCHCTVSAVLDHGVTEKCSVSSEKFCNRNNSSFDYFLHWYYFLTGERPCLGQISMQNHRESIADSFRRMMQGEELSAGRLEELALRSTGEDTRGPCRSMSSGSGSDFHWLLRFWGRASKVKKFPAGKLPETFIVFRKQRN